MKIFVFVATFSVFPAFVEKSSLLNLGIFGIFAYGMRLIFNECFMDSVILLCAYE